MVRLTSKLCFAQILWPAPIVGSLIQEKAIALNSYQEKRSLFAFSLFTSTSTAVVAVTGVVEVVPYRWQHLHGCASWVLLGHPHLRLMATASSDCPWVGSRD